MKDDKKTDFTDVYSYIGEEFACPYCGRTHHIKTRTVVNERDAGSRLPDILGGVVEGRNVSVLCDDVTYGIAGEGLSQMLSGAGWKVNELVLRPKGTRTVHAEDRYLPEISGPSEGSDLLLTVGSGSITDMGKYVARQLGITAACYPTAPSMNAYTSDVSPMIMDGLKITMEATAPVAVVIDSRLVADAPKELIRAGISDAMAKAGANADWLTSKILFDTYYCPIPGQIVTASEKRYIDKGERLISGDEEVVSSLIDGLVRGGFAMVIAGSSSPASGGEHMISHYLDMFRHSEEKDPFAYHGLQVGVGVCVSSLIYDRIRKMDLSEVEGRLKVRGSIDHEARMKSAFPGADVLFAKEWDKKKGMAERLAGELAVKWEKQREEVFNKPLTAEKAKGFLGAAGSPTTFKELGVDKKLAREAVLSGRYIRGKMTILDTADELGILEEVAEEVE